jgi:phytanoyl-CoA hydroxylase
VHSLDRAAAGRDFLKRVISYADLGTEDPFRQYYLRHRVDQGVLYDVLQRHPALWDLATAPRVLDELATVLGEDIFMYENSVVFKPPGRRNAVPYHQDFISRPNEPRKLIAWTALEKVTIENGAMKVLPGSHRDGFLEWHRVKGETHHDRIVDHAIPDTPPLTAELEPGDVLIFNQLLVHGSDEVSSDSLRIALRVSYQGFDSINVPRGSPIVVRGGAPESLAVRFSRPVVAPVPMPFWRRAIRFAGRKLASF